MLRPGGALLFNVWDRIEDNEFADTVDARRSRRCFPDDPPRFLARTPHGYHDRAAIERDLRAGGFARRAGDRHDRRAQPRRSPRVPAVAYCQGTPLRNEIEARAGAGAGLAAAMADCEAALAARFGAGPVDGRIRSIVVVAVRDQLRRRIQRQRKEASGPHAAGR